MKFFFITLKRRVACLYYHSLSTIIVQLSFGREVLFYYMFSCTQKFDSNRVQAEICRKPTSTMQKACSYTCAEVLIGHTWLTYLSEARVQPCTHLYTPILQSNKYRKQELSTRIILRKKCVSIHSQTVCDSRISEGKTEGYTRMSGTKNLAFNLDNM